MTIHGWKSTTQKGGAPSDMGEGGNSVLATNPKQKHNKKKMTRMEKRKGNSYKDLGNYILYFSGVQKTNRARAGVITEVHKNVKTCVKLWEDINERLVKLELNIWRHEITIIAVYAPTEDTIVKMKDVFEYKLIARQYK